MSTHCALGVKHPDGKITGCYVHYDGATMEPRIKDFISKKTTTGLLTLIASAQAVGGIRGIIAWIGYVMATTKPTSATITSSDDSPI